MLEYTHTPGRIVGTDGGTTLAELRYTAVDAYTWSVTSTFVDPSLRGQGVAGRLMEAVVRAAEAEDRTLTATCSYAVTWLSRHPEVPQR